MKTKHLLIGFGFFLYAGMILLTFFHNGILIDTIVTTTIATISVIVGYIVSGVSKKNNSNGD